MFNIQNNASFVRSKDGFESVDFVNPPLGGSWTQEHLVSAINSIEQQPRYALHTKDILLPLAGAECDSYADPK